MLWFSKNRAYPIGIDIAEDCLKVVQLVHNGSGVMLMAGGSQNRPVYIEPGSAEWQKWAIKAIRELTGNGKFVGKKIVAAMPACEVFIDYVKAPKTTEDKLEETIGAKVRQKLPFESEGAMIKYVPAEEDNVIVIAAERKKIDRHLAIYEKANLQIASIGIWPMALINCYVSFFGRRRADADTIVMLIDLQANCTNVVICRQRSLLFARSIPLGIKQLINDEMVSKLVFELTGCKRYFASMYRKNQVERAIFLTPGHKPGTEDDVCTVLARQLEMPAQIGDCLAAVEIPDPYECGIDRRGCQINWATAFGLSLP